MMEAAATRIVVGLVRRTWLVALVTLIVCASFAAHAVASLVEARYLDTTAHGPAPLASRFRPVQVATPPASKPDGTQLVARNMFCSTCEVSPGPTSGFASAFAPEATLIATSIGADPSATVRATATDAQGSYGLGDVIPGVGTITRIGFVSIDITNTGGVTGTLSLLSPQSSGGRSDPGAATPAPAAADPFDGRIKKIDDTTFEVERGLVRDLVTGSVKTGGARIAPVSKDGKLDGLRLIGVRPGSPAAALGLANRDVLTTINGTKIESANNLLDLYAQLDKLSTVELGGTRDGKPLTLVLRLR
jgi:hypothetical protein